MPILPIISKAVKMGLKMNPAAPPSVVGSITASSQAALARGAKKPVGTSLIPVLPTGQSASSAMTKIEAMTYKSHETSAQITGKLIDQFNKDFDKATVKRNQAITKLYTDEKNAQNEIKDEIPEIEVEIKNLEKEIIELEKTQIEERQKYMNKVFEFKSAAKEADALGKTAERDSHLAKITLMDPWLADIIIMSITIMNKKIEKSNKEKELAEKKILADIVLKRDWQLLESHATDFGVVVPEYPDLPAPLSLPPATAIPKQNAMSVAKKQMFAKWIAAPMVPARGLSVAAIMIMIQSFKSNSKPGAAAQAESKADSMIFKLGGCV